MNSDEDYAAFENSQAGCPMIRILSWTTIEKLFRFTDLNRKRKSFFIYHFWIINNLMFFIPKNFLGLRTDSIPKIPPKNRC